MTQQELDALVDAKVKAGVASELAKTVDPAVRSALFGGGAPSVNKIKSVEVGKDITAARYLKCMARVARDGKTLEHWAKSMHSDDAYLMQQVETKALSATILSDGGSTVPEVLSSEIIMPLYTKIGVTKLGGRRIPLSNGNMTIPRIDTSATVGWLGENQAKPVSQQVTGDVKLNGKKLGVLTAVSNDLLRSSNIAADQWILDDIRNKMFIEMDRAMLYGSGTSYQPGGLSTLLPTSQILGSSSTAFTSTLLTTLYGQLGQDNVQLLQPGIIINAATESYLMNLTTTTGAFLFYAEMVERGTIRGIPYAVSNNAAFTAGSPGYVDFFIGDWSEYLIGEQLPLEVTMSREGTYVSGGVTYSALQNDQTIINVLSIQDYAIRHAKSFIQYTAKLAAS